mmetsp:Transcript_37592/g.61361  ORF Transcript_37592/g.61361 Transcript_37592/m.61361 type:complete len:507 (-) Transcript_37592:218-1738(-)
MTRLKTTRTRLSRAWIHLVCCTVAKIMAWTCNCSSPTKCLPTPLPSGGFYLASVCQVIGDRGRAGTTAQGGVNRKRKRDMGYTNESSCKSSRPSPAPVSIQSNGRPLLGTKNRTSSNRVSASVGVRALVQSPHRTHRGCAKNGKTKPDTSCQFDRRKGYGTMNYWKLGEEYDEDQFEQLVIALTGSSEEAQWDRSFLLKRGMEDALLDPGNLGAIRLTDKAIKEEKTHVQLVEDAVQSIDNQAKFIKAGYDLKVSKAKAVAKKKRDKFELAKLEMEASDKKVVALCEETAATVNPTMEIIRALAKHAKGSLANMKLLTRVRACAPGDRHHENDAWMSLTKQIQASIFFCSKKVRDEMKRQGLVVPGLVQFQEECDMSKLGGGTVGMGELFQSPRGGTYTATGAPSAAATDINQQPQKEDTQAQKLETSEEPIIVASQSSAIYQPEVARAAGALGEIGEPLSENTCALHGNRIVTIVRVQHPAYLVKDIKDDTTKWVVREDIKPLQE